jgi:hypothetical protein
VLAGRSPTDISNALHASFPPGGVPSPDIGPIVDRVHAETPSAPTAPAPLAFVRDLPAAEGLARTVPPWANGMAVTRAYGPFLSASGGQRWIDVITIRKSFAVVRGPGHVPLCLLQIEVPLIAPTAATVTGTLGAGSLWLVGKAFAPAAPADAFAGLAFSDGKVTISGAFSVANDVIVLSAAATLTLELAPVPPPSAGSGTGAGGDFRNSLLTLPASVTFIFAPNGNALAAMDPAALKAYGSAASYARQNAAPVYNAALALLAFPCKVTPTTFAITQHASTIFAPAGSAPVVVGAYALPVALTTPQSLGAAASGGYLTLALGEGLVAAINDDPAPTPLVGAVLLRTGTTLVVFADTAVPTTMRYDLWDGGSARASSLEITMAAGAIISPPATLSS